MGEGINTMNTAMTSPEGKAVLYELKQDMALVDTKEVVKTEKEVGDGINTAMTSPEGKAVLNELNTDEITGEVVNEIKQEMASGDSDKIANDILQEMQRDLKEVKANLQQIIEGNNDVKDTTLNE